MIVFSNIGIVSSPLIPCTLTEKVVLSPAIFKANASYKITDIKNIMSYHPHTSQNVDYVLMSIQGQMVPLSWLCKTAMQ